MDHEKDTNGRARMDQEVARTTVFKNGVEIQCSAYSVNKGRSTGNRGSFVATLSLAPPLARRPARCARRVVPGHASGS